MNYSGFVAIIGRPNVGKSTLLNAIIGEKVAITADKPQTTRNRIRGIYNDKNENGDRWQIVFLDTPGITTPRNKLGEYMASAALKSMEDVDAVLFLIDEPWKGKGGDAFILERLKQVKTPKILVINKMDTMSPPDFQATYDASEATGLFAGIMGTCARDGGNVPQLMAMLKDHISEGVPWFPEDMITDHPERFLGAEIIREKLLRYLRDEVPHGVAVEIESWEEEAEVTKISAVIFTEKKSHKGIIIGKDGRKLKGVGKSAREDLEALLGAKVFLQLWVKVKDQWRDSDFMLRSLGYRE
jgi:GTP-binding protein Era